MISQIFFQAFAIGKNFAYVKVTIIQILKYPYMFVFI